MRISAFVCLEDESWCLVCLFFCEEHKLGIVRLGLIGLFALHYFIRIFIILQGYKSLKIYKSKSLLSFLSDFNATNNISKIIIVYLRLEIDELCFEFLFENYPPIIFTKNSLRNLANNSRITSLIPFFLKVSAHLLKQSHPKASPHPLRLHAQTREVHSLPYRHILNSYSPVQTVVCVSLELAGNHLVVEDIVNR